MDIMNYIYSKVILTVLGGSLYRRSILLNPCVLIGLVSWKDHIRMTCKRTLSVLVYDSWYNIPSADVYTVIYMYISIWPRYHWLMLKGHRHDWWSLFTISFFPKFLNISSMKPSKNRTTIFKLIVHGIELHTAFEKRENKQKNAKF